MDPRSKASEQQQTSSLHNRNGQSGAESPSIPVTSLNYPPMPASASTTAGEMPTRGEIWLQRTMLIVRVVFLLELGLFLTVLPWMDAWSHNGLLLPHEWLQVLLVNNFVRGAVSGLGLVDLWLGISEAVRYREPWNS
jgi:hypothetical protein